MSYKCKHTEKELKKIWRLANYLEKHGKEEIALNLRQQYKELHQEYVDRRYKMNNNYIFKGDI